MPLKDFLTIECRWPLWIYYFAFSYFSLQKPKRRVPASYGGRSIASIEKSFHTRSMSFNSERTRVRGRSPAFNALAANFENPNRNLSTPPPPLVGKKLFPRFLTPNSTKITSPRSDVISTFTSTLETPTENFTRMQLRHYLKKYIF